MQDLQSELNKFADVGSADKSFRAKLKQSMYVSLLLTSVPDGPVFCSRRVIVEVRFVLIVVQTKFKMGPKGRRGRSWPHTHLTDSA